ncbi:hypothetical protein AAG570_011710 [Ranatra chinensis]|uniref:Uncharacterized protein n=1 Tax=Ranatra chinensis TaxID=642074 RepID=A0ABD0YV49_9HEMI
MASKRRNMFYKNKKQETMEMVDSLIFQMISSCSYVDIFSNYELLPNVNGIRNLDKNKFNGNSLSDHATKEFHSGARDRGQDNRNEHCNVGDTGEDVNDLSWMQEVWEPLDNDNKIRGNYYNKQLKRDAFKNLEDADSDYPVYVQKFDSNDFTRDYITDFINLRKDNELSSGWAKREAANSSAMRETYDDIYNKIKKDIGEIKRLQDQASREEEKGRPNFARRSNSAEEGCQDGTGSDAAGETKVPAAVQHIDRNTVEEIIQIDIPRKKKQCREKGNNAPASDNAAKLIEGV